ncbi:MAG: TIGR02452 family protein [bacterium]|nr:TIGR02452 family protein [bacterium]MDY4099982.1 TIGR02452 family protein [Lachnospiraceae bacterium]
MGKTENVMVFEDTENLCKDHQRIRDSVKQSTDGQKLILENDELSETDKNRYESPAKVVVSKKRTFEAAAAYKGTKTAVHNFASASNPGGGVVNGANAQEECLCRCSGLYFCLNTKQMWDGFYEPHRKTHDPLHNDDVIFTPEVTVFKTDTAQPKLMNEKDWYDVDVITCAAPNLRSRPSNGYNSGDGNQAVKIKDKDLLALHEKRLRRILNVAVLEEDETVILGAFGCGAFMNNPQVVALAAKNVIKEYLHAFKNIEFAVYCSPKDDQNYRIFERVLKGYCE